MGELVVLPEASKVFRDTRGQGRILRATWHPASNHGGDGSSDDDIVVLSLWRGPECTGSFRLTRDDAARLVDVLSDSPSER